MTQREWDSILAQLRKGVAGVTVKTNAWILKVLAEGYEKRTWHGPNLKQSIRGVSAKQAAWRPGRKRHNIWEVTLHAAYWKYALRRRDIKPDSWLACDYGGVWRGREFHWGDLKRVDGED